MWQGSERLEPRIFYLLSIALIVNKSRFALSVCERDQKEFPLFFILAANSAGKNFISSPKLKKTIKIQNSYAAVTTIQT